MRVACGIQSADMSAHGVADQVQLLNSQCINHAGQVLGLGAYIIAASRFVAGAETRQIEGYNSVILAEVAGETQPVVLVGSKTVHHQDGLCAAWAALVVMNAKIAHADVFETQPGTLSLHQLYVRQQSGG